MSVKLGAGSLIGAVLGCSSILHCQGYSEGDSLCGRAVFRFVHSSADVEGKEVRRETLAAKTGRGQDGNHYKTEEAYGFHGLSCGTGRDNRSHLLSVRSRRSGSGDAASGGVRRVGQSCRGRCAFLTPCLLRFQPARDIFPALTGRLPSSIDTDRGNPRCGVWMGSRVASRVPVRALKLFVGIFSVGLSIYMLVF